MEATSKPPSKREGQCCWIRCWMARTSTGCRDNLKQSQTVATPARHIVGGCSPPTAADRPQTRTPRGRRPEACLEACLDPCGENKGRRGTTAEESGPCVTATGPTYLITAPSTMTLATQIHGAPRRTIALKPVGGRGSRHEALGVMTCIMNNELHNQCTSTKRTPMPSVAPKS